MSQGQPGTSMSMIEDVRVAARAIVERFPRSYLLKCDREGRFPQEMWEALASQGLLGLGVPESYGGVGGGVTDTIALYEAIASAGTNLGMFGITSFARVPILKYGSHAQIERFVKPTVSGERKLAFAITEPDAGTNSFAMKSFARPDGDDWILRGQKVYISGATTADDILVVARTQREEDVATRTGGLSLFVVDAKSPGLECRRMDINAVPGDRQYSVFFDDVRIPGDRLVGEAGNGAKYLFDGLNPERLIAAMLAVGAGCYALEKGVAYVRERVPFGRPTGSYQGIQHPMARAKARLEAARLMVYDCARRFDAGESIGAQASMAKLLATEAADEALDITIQAFGGAAFDAANDVHTLWQQIRALRIVPINNEMVLNHIAEQVLGLPKSY